MSKNKSGVLVWGEFSVWHTVASVVGALGAFVGMVLVIWFRQPMGWFVGSAGVVVMLSAGRSAYYAGLQRMWVKDLGTGLAIRDRQGCESIRTSKLWAWR